MPSRNNAILKNGPNELGGESQYLYTPTSIQSVQPSLARSPLDYKHTYNDFTTVAFEEVNSAHTTEALFAEDVLDFAIGMFCF